VEAKGNQVPGNSSSIMVIFGRSNHPCSVLESTHCIYMDDMSIIPLSQRDTQITYIELRRVKVEEIRRV